MLPTKLHRMHPHTQGRSPSTQAPTLQKQEPQQGPVTIPPSPPTQLAPSQQSHAGILASPLQPIPPVTQNLQMLQGAHLVSPQPFPPQMPPQMMNMMMQSMAHWFQTSQNNPYGAFPPQQHMSPPGATQPNGANWFQFPQNHLYGASPLQQHMSPQGATQPTGNTSNPQTPPNNPDENSIKKGAGGK